ncbi:TetR/AcrR family transcriptional regulator [Neobacillus sp. PS2-9]|uniref:TetR/AcrR family transcriptional regulator n=1 Tax=Neobacillus sp. PS2-9 TaxID=3070676 RepID=UPI0027E042F4|nr:TetR/AcrR family transcriptional regulator [Neobacillus sp. PS2-9]WML56202.1 TetR/AcrR family transcriptional regulator [Neobacillus sp. PS2-9]
MPPIVSDSHKEKKKKEILASALVCFAKKGFQVATIDDIVGHSGISKGAIYNYFKSKDEIYLELMNTDTKETYESLVKDLGTYDSAIEKIDFLFNLYLLVDFSNKDIKGKFIVHDEFKLHASRHPELAEKLTDRRKQYFVDLLAGIIKEGQESGEIKKDLHPEVMADLFWSMINGVTVQSVYTDYPFKQVLTEMKQMFLEKIKA